MTFLLPQAVPELLDFQSDFDSIPALTCQPDIILKDGSNVISPLKDLNSTGPSKPEYIIVKERQKVQEQDSLKLRLRVTTTGSCGSASSSPSEAISDNDVDVQQFLNLSSDFVVMEESKQVLEDSPETPPPTVRSLTSILSKSRSSPNKQSKQTVRPSLNKQSKNIRNNVCRAIPVPRTKLNDQKKEPNKSMYAKTALSSKVGQSAIQEMFHKSSKREQTTSSEKSNKTKDKYPNEGAMIGSMERGPRMFGVRYGPCDSPLNKTELSQARDNKRHISLHDRLKKAEMKTHKPISLTGQSVMNNNQKLKINANQRAPKLPPTPPHYKDEGSPPHSSYSQDVRSCTKYRAVESSSIMLSERITPKDKTDLPPFKKIKIPLEETRWFEELRKEEQKWRIQEEKQIIPYISPRPHLSVLNQGNNNNNNNNNTNNNNTHYHPSPPSIIRSVRAETVKELYFQHHMYCSIDKPLFESDPEALKISEVYQLVLNTYLSLEAQRTTTLQDIDKLENLKCQAVKRPYKFIKLFQKGELVFPKRQEIVKLPNINLTYKQLDLGNPPSENSKAHPTEQSHAKLKSYDREAL